MAISNRVANLGVAASNREWDHWRRTFEPAEQVNALYGAGPELMRRRSAHLKNIADRGNLEGRHSAGAHELTVSQRDEGFLGGLIKKPYQVITALPVPVMTMKSSNFVTIRGVNGSGGLRSDSDRERKSQAKIQPGS